MAILSFLISDGIPTLQIDSPNPCTDVRKLIFALTECLPHGEREIVLGGRLAITTEGRMATEGGEKLRVVVVGKAPEKVGTAHHDAINER